jgi:hypothetical protein
LRETAKRDLRWAGTCWILPFSIQIMSEVGIVFIDIECGNVCFLLQIKIVLDKDIFVTYIAGEGVAR